MTRSLTCTEIQELLPRWIDGELSEAEQSRFGDHLRECSACRGLADEHRAVQEGLELLGRLADRIADRPSVARPPAPAPLRFGRLLRIAAGIVLIAGATVWLATSPWRARDDAPAGYVGADNLPPAAADFTPKEGPAPAAAGALVQVAVLDPVEYLQTRVETRNRRVHVVWLYPTASAEAEPVTQ